MIGIQDFLNYVSLSQLTLSPDEKRAAFVVKQPVLQENTYKKELWVCELKSGKSRCLLEDADFVGSFSWEDESTLFYPACQAQDTTLCRLLDVTTGQVRDAVTLPAVTQEVWHLGEGRYVYRHAEQLIRENYPQELSFLSDYADGFETIDEIPLWDNGRGFVSGKRSALYTAQLQKCGKDDDTCFFVEKVTADFTTVDQVIRKPEGLYYTARTYRGRNTEPGIYFLADTASVPEQLVEEGVYRIMGFDVSDNPQTGRRQVYFTAQDKRIHCMTDDPGFYTAVDRHVEKLPIADTSASDSVSSDCLYGSSPDFAVRDGKFYYLSTEEWDSFLKETAPDGQTRKLTPAGGAVNGFVLLSDGSVCFIGLRGMKLQELYLCCDGELTQLTRLNEERLDASQVIEPESFTFSNHGFNVNYVVLPPADFDPAKKYPAILYIHGGAKVLYTKVFFHEMQYLASQGYYVIYGNPHGSDGQGSEFAKLLGHYGEKDYEDLMMAMDEALRRYPNIDKERLGVAGGSYGGIMTNWTVTHTDRFRCAVAQRSICSMLSTFGTADNGFNFVKEQMDGDLWNGFDKLWRQSPLKYANQCHTPLLLIHSDEDYRCHYTEAIEMFTALKYLGVETKVCLIRGENHSLSRTGRPVQRIKRLYEIVKWFDEHLKTDGEKNVTADATPDESDETGAASCVRERA